MSDIKEVVKTLASSLKGDLKYEKDTHTIKSEDNVYAKHLPEELTMEIVEKVNGYDVAFVAASGMAVGEMAIEQMAKEKSVDQISAEFPMGKKNSVAHVVTRERTFTNITDPSNPIHKFGDLASTLTVNAGRNQGELKKVRNYLHDIAVEQLNKK
jgi:hypothetical protein